MQKIFEKAAKMIFREQEKAFVIYFKKFKKILKSLKKNGLSLNICGNIDVLKDDFLVEDGGNVPGWFWVITLDGEPLDNYDFESFSQKVGEQTDTIEEEWSDEVVSLLKELFELMEGLEGQPSFAANSSFIVNDSDIEYELNVCLNGANY